MSHLVEDMTIEPCLCQVCSRQVKVRKVKETEDEIFYRDNSDSTNQLTFLLHVISDIFINDPNVILRLDVLDTVIFNTGEIQMHVYSDKH